MSPVWGKVAATPIYQFHKVMPSVVESLPDGIPELYLYNYLMD